MNGWHFVLAALAPLTVWLLWRVQAVVVDAVLRRSLLKLLRYQKRTYNFISWFGTFLHEVSHAIVLILTGHGIKQFKAGIDAGHVLPKRMPKNGVKLIGFLAAAMAPLYLPPLAIFLVAWLALGALPSPVVRTLTDVKGIAALDPRRLADVPLMTPDAFLNANLVTVAGVVLVLLALLATPSSRPSYVKRDGQAEGDIAVIRRLVQAKPWPLIAFLGLLYASYFVFLAIDIRWFWTGYLLVASVSLVGISVAILAALVWVLVAWTGRAKPWIGWLPYAWLIAAQVVPRTMELGWTPRIINVISLAVFALGALLVRAIAPRRF